MTKLHHQQRIIYLANPRGFCSGVRRAIQLAHDTLAAGHKPLYALNELVHNRQVVEELEKSGVRTVYDLADVPCGATLLLSAHGVAPAVRSAAAARGINTVDATCPFVLKVHADVIRYAGEGFSIAYIGQHGHEEAVGVHGEAPDRITILENAAEAEQFQPSDSARVAVAMQTTWSAEEAGRVMAVLKRRFPTLKMSARSDICHATTLRQAAVKALARQVDFILVLGGRNSSNTLRLQQVAQRAGAQAHLVSRMDDLDSIPLGERQTIGLTAGASTPENFISRVTDRLQQYGFGTIREMERVRL